MVILAHLGVHISNYSFSVVFYSQFGFTVTREDFEKHVVLLHHVSGLELNLLDSAIVDKQGRNVLMDETLSTLGLPISPCHR
jgi:hypothetical protein